MQIASVTASEHADFLALVNAEIRPDRAKTNAWEDFPLILSPENREWQLVCHAPDGSLAAGVACLIRDYETSCGRVAVAGIGSVVTAPAFRGQGLSSALQSELLARLKGKNIPLGVLWTDRPAIYAGRGFVAAGWEYHVDLERAQLPAPTVADGGLRDYHDADAPHVEALYHAHRLHTWRRAGDSRQLYGMAGTWGRVAVDRDDKPLAALFCGKGADFQGYAAEWSGPSRLVLALLTDAVGRGLAHHVLVPAGAERFVDTLVQHGAAWFGQASGYWVVIDPAPLMAAVRAGGLPPPPLPADPTAWLGCVDEMGRPQRGLLEIAVWGLDSV